MPIPLSDAITPGGAFPVVNGGGQKIPNVADPTLPQDVATRAYVRSNVGGQTITAPDWYIDGVAGSDANDGLTALTAFATIGKLFRTWGPGALLKPNLGILKVHLLSASFAESLDFVGMTLDADSVLVIVGLRTTVRTSTITTATPKAQATNQAFEIDDASLAANDWTADLDRRVRITSGANINCYAWVAKDLGGTAARLSDFGTLIDENAFYTPGTIANGDPYVVETVASVARASFEIFTQGGGVGGWVTVLDVDLGYVTAGGPTVYVFMYGCKMSGLSPFNGCQTYPVQCCNTGAAFGYSVFCFQASVLLEAGLVRKSVQVISSFGQVNGNTLFQGVVGGQAAFAVLDGSTGYLVDVAFFDCAVTCFLYGFGGSTANGGSLIAGGGTGKIWGAGNTLTATVEAGCTFAISNPALITVASTAEFLIEGLAVARPWNEAGGVFGSPVACTWANLLTYGNLGNPKGGARIVSLVAITDPPANGDDLSLSLGPIHVRKGQVQTADAASTPIPGASWTLPPNTTAAIDCVVTATLRTTGADCGRWKFSGFYNLVAGVATLVGALETGTPQKTAGAAGWAPTLAPGGLAAVEVLAVGGAATDIDWVVEMRIQEGLST